MKKKIALISLLLFSITARADFNDGIVAYTMGDYERAFSVMQSLGSVANHAYAQYYLGIMYLRGQGVAQDDENAGKWFREAAENRIPQAQYYLGKLYMKGRGVPKDYEFAYAWLRTGAAHKHNLSLSTLPQAKEKLTGSTLIEAEKLATDFIEKYGPALEEPDRRQPIRLE